jgi:hypothetical protein
MQFVIRFVICLVAVLYLLYDNMVDWFSTGWSNEWQRETWKATTICIPTVKREPFYLFQVIYSFFHLCARHPDIAQNVLRIFIFQLDSHRFYPYWNDDTSIPLRCRKKVSIHVVPSIFPSQNMTYYHWRCKEALDYARTLENCERLADKGTYFYLVHQDDVVFNRHFPSLFTDLCSWMSRAKWRRTCSISLYDIKQRTDGGPLLSNNAVSRLYPSQYLKSLRIFIESQYRKQPVDWLIEEYCRAAHLTTFVKVPNPTDHIGNISTFAGKVPLGRHGTPQRQVLLWRNSDRIVGLPTTL